MENQEASNYEISEDDFNLAKGTNGIARIVTRYNNAPPPGWEVVLLDQNDNLVRVLCPRPCPSVSLSTQV